MTFFSKDFLSKCEQIQFPTDLVLFTEETLRQKLPSLCMCLAIC